VIKADHLEGAAMRLRIRAGLNPDPVGRVRLERLLTESAMLAGVPVASYLDLVDAQPAAFGDLVDRVTVQHSGFFRDPAQFIAVSTLARNSNALESTIWSAGCGNGQEAYSLAMLLDEIGLSRWHVVASDISRQAIARTLAAWYSDADVKGLSAERRKRYLVPVPGGYEIAPFIKARVRIAHHNLAIAGDPPPVPMCAMVFCRNVLMYFGHEEAQACVARLAARIHEGGHLFLGHSDITGRIAGHFALTQVAGALCYRRLPEPVVGTADPSVERKARVRPHPSALMAQGESAAAGGDLRMAIRAFRQALYIDPNLPAAYFQLGAAFERAGDAREARRAFAAAGLALMRGGDVEQASPVEGYAARDLARAIANKLTGPVR
jgi:chemotaxis methyl-accepting protein methylase